MQAIKRRLKNARDKAGSEPTPRSSSPFSRLRSRIGRSSESLSASHQDSEAGSHLSSQSSSRSALHLDAGNAAGAQIPNLSNTQPSTSNNSGSAGLLMKESPTASTPNLAVSDQISSTEEASAQSSIIPTATADHDLCDSAEHSVSPRICLVPPEEPHDLWELAIKKLPVEKQKLLEGEITDLKRLGASTRTDIVEQFVRNAKQRIQDCKDNRWGIQIGNKRIVLRAVIEKIVDFANKFRDIGNTVIQYDPVHTALPWAAFALILQFSVADSALFGQILCGLESIAKVVTDCVVFEKLYLPEKVKNTVSPSLVQKFQDSLVQVYSSMLAYLLKTLHCCRQSGLVKFVQGIWYLEDLNDILKKIEEAENQLRKSVETIQHEVLKNSNESVAQSVRKLNNDLSEILQRRFLRFDDQLNSLVGNLESERRSDILKWLSIVDYPNHHGLAKKDHTPGTGRWLLNNNVFLEWLDSNTSSCLWLKGNAGTGKTKLASLVIESLRERNQSPEGSEALAYFYCNRDDPQRRKPEIILSTLIQQLACLRYGDPLQKAIIDEYETRKNATGHPSPLDLGDACCLAKVILDIYPQSLIVVDALDECDKNDRSDFLKGIYELAMESRSLVKIFVTSRLDEDIAEIFMPRCIPTVFLESGNQQMDRDIRAIVEANVDKVVEKRGNLFKKLVPGELAKVKEEMIQILVQGAGGMPLWVRHQINNLIHNWNIRTPDQAIITLKSFPSGLTATYEYLLRDLLLHPEDGNNALGIIAFKWVMTAIRPLGEDEFMGALLIEGEGSNSITNMDMQDILAICRNLLIYDEKGKVIRFYHLSVREFLEEHGNNLFIKDVIQARSEIIGKPMLRFCEIESWDKDRQCFLLNSTSYHRSIQHIQAFFLYIALTWPGYFQKQTESEALVHFLLYQKAYKAWASWLMWGLSDPLKSFKKKDGYGPKSALLGMDWDSIFGMHPVDYPKVSWWDKNSMRLISLWKRYPVVACSHWGFEKLVQILARQGADAGISRVLEAAAGSGNEDTTRFLVENGGADCNNSLALGVAAKNGHMQIVKFLVQNGARANDPDALEGAATQGHEQIVGFLIENGADADNLEALEGAAENGHEQIVRFLVENGASANAPGALIGAACRKNEQMVRFLVENGADASNSEALSMGAIYGHEPIVKFLIEKSTNANISEALLSAAHEGQEQIVKLLVENGADSYTKALAVAAKEGHEQIVRFLVENRADVDKSKALKMAAKGGYDRIVRFLVEKGADADNLKALGLAAREGYKEILMFLVKNGANANNPDTLRQAARYSFGQILKFHSDNGADINKLELEAFQLAIKKSHEQIVRFLVENGADVNNPEALRLAIENGYEQTVRLLVENGADASSPSILQLAAYDQEQVVRLLVQNGADANNLKALQRAVHGGNEQVLRFLVENGADAKNPKILTSAVAAANVNTGLEIISFLVEKGADAKNPEALISAAENVCNGLEIIKFLVDKGADAKNPEALKSAAKNGYCGLEIVKFLIDKGADAKNPEALISAAGNLYSGQEIVNLLVEKGADARNPRVLKSAAQNGHGRLVKFLVEKGADAKISKALISAAKNELCGEETIRFLVGKGADVQNPKALILATENHNWGLEITKFLVENGANPKNPEALKSAAKNKDSGLEITEFLVKQGADAKNPEVLISAAKNKSCGLEILKFLIEKGADARNPEVLVSAAENDKLGPKIIKFLVGKGADVKNPEVLKSILKYQESMYNVKFLKFLIENGADAKNPEALTIAVTNGLMATKFLVEKGADAKNPEALKLAAATIPSYSKDIVKWLINNGADARDPEALASAAENRACGLKLVRLFVEKGADAKNPKVLKLAAKNERFGLDILRFLFKQGADMRNPEALISAAENRFLGLEITKFLIQEGADAKNPEALKSAAGNEDWGLEIVKLLVEKGANARNPEALESAAKNLDCGFEIITFLAGKGADAKKQGIVELAAESGHEVLVRFLVENGMDANNSDALQRAAENGHIRIVRFLVEKGADAKSPQALRAAAENEHDDIVEFLVEKGADVRLLHPYPEA